MLGARLRISRDVRLSRSQTKTLVQRVLNLERRTSPAKMRDVATKVPKRCQMTRFSKENGSFAQRSYKGRVWNAFIPRNTVRACHAFSSY